MGHHPSSEPVASHLRAGVSKMSTICETTLRVRYAETDQMRVAHHSNYIVWFEVGRIELLRELGFTYGEMEEDGMHLPVVEVRCRYKHPARFDDEITIRTRLARCGESVLRFQLRGGAQRTSACWPKAKVCTWWWATI
jgi:YbgC/YbaW family acyl-CoA thioester hydrolase